MYTQDFTVKRGETFSKDIYFKSNDEPYNLSGYTAKSQIRPYAGNNKISAEINCTVNDNKGYIHLELSKEQTYSMKAGTYFYDLCLSKDNINTYYLQGKFIVNKFITEPPVDLPPEECDDYYCEDYECTEDFCDDYECIEDEEMEP